MDRLDRRRIERLAHDGDREAALALRNEARRRGDRELAVRAAAALDDIEDLIELAIECWRNEAWHTLEQAGRAMGFVLDRGACATLEGALERAHGRRRLRLMRRSDVLRTMAAARLAGSYATHHAGKPTSRGSTTVCLAVQRDAETLVVGLARAEGPLPSDVETWAGGLGPWGLIDKHTRSVQWAHGAPAPDRIEITVCEPAVRARTVSPSHAPRERHLEQLLAVEPDIDVYEELVSVVRGWPRAARRDAVVSAAEAALEPWPLERRTLSRHADAPAIPIAGPLTLHPLQHHLCLELPVDMTRLEAAPEVLGQIRSLEIVEHGRRDAFGAREAVLWLLGQSPLRHRLQRLELRIRSLDVLRAVAECEWLLGRLRTLVVHRGDPMDLGWGKAFAAVFERCTRLERFELVHRGPLTYMIPALKRVHRVEHVRLSLGRVGYARLEQALTNLRRAAPRSLDLHGTDLRAGGLSTIAQAPALGHLESLALVSCQLDADAPDRLSRAVFADKLERLDLAGNTLGSEADLTPLQALSSLRSLRTGRCGLALAQLESLFADARFSLRHLDVRRNALGPALGGVLAGAPCLAGLEEAELAVTQLDEGVGDLMSAPFVSSLRRLDLRRARRGDAWIDALAEASPVNLTHLDLGSCDLSASGLQRLLDAHNLHLETLRLDRNPLRAAGLRALATWPALSSILRLDLTQTRGGRDARAILADSPWLRALVAGVEGLQHSVAWRR